MNQYTVIGLHPDDSWGDGMYEASFVEHVEAQGPIDAASVARGRMAATDNRDPGAYIILGLFEGHLADLYDPALDTNGA